MVRPNYSNILYKDYENLKRKFAEDQKNKNSNKKEHELRIKEKKLRL